MARLSPLTRARIRVTRGRSEDDRDVARDLRRALKRAANRAGEVGGVQVAGLPLESGDYRHWRERALRRGTVSTAPELEPGRYALVLFAFRPSSTNQFLRHGAGSQLTPPTVGMFRPTTEPAVALAGTLASWLEIYARPVELAPPLLKSGERWRVAGLGLDWSLPPHEG